MPTPSPVVEVVPTATPVPTPTPRPTATAVPTPTPTPTLVPLASVSADPCPQVESPGIDTGAELPAALVNLIEQALDDPLFNDLDVSFSASIDGYQGRLERNPELELLPASNQKIVSAFGVAELLDLNDRFVTRVEQHGIDVHLVASGDPTLTQAALRDMARSVASAGLIEVRTLYVVERYTTGISAPGWRGWHVPTYIGPLSGFMVDDNWYRIDDAYVADPALFNTELFAEMLDELDVKVGAVAEWDPDTQRPDDGIELASITSATFADIATRMLLWSDNQNAEQLVNEIGYRFGRGTISDGTARIAETLATWCLDLTGANGDGSGLSRSNLRSAGEFHRLLQHARTEPWFEWFRNSLPIAGQTGTLSRRFVASPAEGLVIAKTGSIFGGRSLSGYGTTVGNRPFVFSIIVNGATAKTAKVLPAVDALVTRLVEHPD